MSDKMQEAVLIRDKAARLVKLLEFEGSRPKGDWIWEGSQKADTQKEKELVDRIWSSAKNLSLIFFPQTGLPSEEIRNERELIARKVRYFLIAHMNHHLVKPGNTYSLNDNDLDKLKSIIKGEEYPLE